MATLKVWIEDFRGKHRVRFRDPRKRKRDIWPISIFAKKSDANKAKKKFYDDQVRKATGDTDLEAALPALLNRWYADCRAGLANRKGKVIKESTIETYKSSLKYVVEKVQLIGELDNTWVEDYARLLYEIYEGWTPHRRLVDLKSFCSYLQRKKIIGWDPFTGIVIARPESKPRFYTDEEIDAMEAACVSLEDPFGLLFIRLGYLCGLRFGEATQLKLEDIRPHTDPEFEGWGDITVWETESKTRSNRVVLAPPKVMELLVNLCAKRRQGRVFEGWKENQFLYAWARIVAQAGMKPAEWYAKRYEWARVDPKGERSEAPYHGLRHTFCRRFVENGGDMTELQKFSGHKSVEVLMKTYAHFANKHLHLRGKEVYERMESRQKFVGQMWGKPIKNLETLGNNLGHSGTQTDAGQVAESDGV